MTTNRFISQIARNAAETVRKHGLAREGRPHSPRKKFDDNRGMLDRALATVDANGCHPLALSITPAWAECIVAGWKDVENRSWKKPKVTGWIYVHAMASQSYDEYVKVCSFVSKSRGARLFSFPMPEELKKGGIVGAMKIAAWVDTTDSEWFIGPHAAIITDFKRFPFQPLKGKQGFFSVEMPSMEEIARV